MDPLLGGGGGSGSDGGSLGESGRGRVTTEDLDPERAETLNIGTLERQSSASPRTQSGKRLSGAERGTSGRRLRSRKHSADAHSRQGSLDMAAMCDVFVDDASIFSASSAGSSVTGPSYAVTHPLLARQSSGQSAGGGGGGGGTPADAGGDVGGPETTPSPFDAKRKWKSVVKKASLMNRMSRSTLAARARHQHKKSTVFDDILEAIQDDDNEDEDDTATGVSPIAEESRSNRGADYDADVHPVFAGELSGIEEQLDNQAEKYDGNHVGERPGDYGAVPATIGPAGPMVPARRSASPIPTGWRLWWRRQKRKLSDRCHPMQLFRRSFHFLKGSFIICVSLPLCIMAMVLFYGLGNPELFWMPGQAKLSWWFNFAARQAVTLELARMTQWLIIDVIILSPFSVNLFGSIVTFYCILSKGWPFVIVAWSIWDLFLIQGDKPFETHWLYWTGLRIYTSANSGVYILDSEFYLRFLVSAIFLGLASSIKRTVLAIRFGKRQLGTSSCVYSLYVSMLVLFSLRNTPTLHFANSSIFVRSHCILVEFKPQLEKILQEISLISEISYIAQESEALADSGVCFDVAEVPKPAPTGVGALRVDFHDVSADDVDDRGDECSEEEESAKGVASTDAEDSSGLAEFKSGDHLLRRSSSGGFAIKDLLDRWEEPSSKADKEEHATIKDVVKFRRVLSFIDETEPFGGAFGPAGNRDQCIDSSHELYRRLHKLTPNLGAIPFSTISIGAEDINGMPDEDKMRALRRLFRPDKGDLLPLIAFIQSIDSVYKRLRYFRASVGNASVIDNVLEKIINGIFYFILSLALLTFMQINPYPLLVSMTSLLVSVSFALGPSVSKFVEGAMLIVVRR